MKTILARISHKSSTALRNLRLHVLRRDKAGTGADFVGFATLQGVDPASPKGYGRTDPASPAHLRETHTSIRSPFARDEFFKICGLALVLGCLPLPIGVSAALSFEVNKISHRATVEETEYKVEFPFTNKGGEAVEILEVSSGCGCTTAVPNQRVFEPGESGEISATFDYGSREGKQVKSILVKTTQADNPDIVLTLEVTIPKTLVATPGVIIWNMASEQPVQARTAIIESHLEYEVDVLEIVSSNERFDHELEVLEKGKKFSLTIRPPDVSEIEGIMRGTFLVKTSIPNPMKSTKKIYAIVR